MSSDRFPLVGTRGKTESEVLAVSERSKAIVETLHNKRFELENQARKCAQSPDQLAELMARVDEELEKSWPDEPARNEEQAIRVQRGFPPDYWLSWEFVERWRSTEYPTERSAKSVGQWQALLERSAAYAFAARNDATGRAILDGMAYDLELLRQFDPSLVVAPDRENLERRSGGTGGRGMAEEHRGAVHPQLDARNVTGDDKSNCSAPLAPSRVKAYGQYLNAVGTNPHLTGATDREVFDWLEEHTEEGEHLPNYAAWSRYLRDARQFHDTSKNTPRIGRQTGKSVVSEHEIEREERA
jgi:hypothetical protein